MKINILHIALGASFLLSTGLLGKVGCQNFELQATNEKLNKELMQSNLELGRAKTEFGDANKYIKTLEQGIQDEIKEREATATRYGILQAKYKKLVKDKKATKVEKVYVEGKTIEVPAELELARGQLYEAVTEKTLVPVEKLSGTYEDHRLKIQTDVNSYPNNERAVDFSFNYALNLKLEAQLVETLTPTGAVNNYITIYEVDNEGKRVGEFELTKFEMIVEKPDKKQFFWWAPHIDIAALALVDTRPQFVPGGSIGFSFMGYGLTKNDLDWRFLRVSMDLTDSIGIGLDPVQYNLGQHIPVFSNLWLGAHVGYGLEGRWQLGLSLGAML